MLLLILFNLKKSICYTLPMSTLYTLSDLMTQLIKLRPILIKLTGLVSHMLEDTRSGNYVSPCNMAGFTVPITNIWPLILVTSCCTTSIGIILPPFLMYLGSLLSWGACNKLCKTWHNCISYLYHTHDTYLEHNQLILVILSVADICQPWGTSMRQDGF